MTKRSPDLIDAIRRMAPEHSAVQIAKAIGVSCQTVIRWADEEAIRLMTRSQARKRAWADPDVRAKISAASKRAWADPDVRAKMSAAMKGCRGVCIPHWVPVDLRDEFLDIAADFGEEHAASHVRRLKAEASKELAR